MLYTTRKKFHGQSWCQLFFTPRQANYKHLSQLFPSKRAGKLGGGSLKGSRHFPLQGKVVEPSKLLWKKGASWQLFLPKKELLLPATAQASVGCAEKAEEMGPSPMGRRTLFYSCSLQGAAFRKSVLPTAVPRPTPCCQVQLGGGSSLVSPAVKGTGGNFYFHPTTHSLPASLPSHSSIHLACVAVAAAAGDWGE